ncbi:hypothetical protein [Endozoicomonas ascidiicola]|uniref:hypothetical protein n=1 Tax=Endozoicomonas ascidiicola TaxID=1698521 RepID=UPI000836BAB3|nr:hypothetical protein [Endozoicomonas ascidiicola]
MKRILLAATLASASTLSLADFSLISGNIQFHDDPAMSGNNDASMMLEFNHFLVNNIDRGRMRLFGRFDGIKVGEQTEGTKSSNPVVTVGVEQEYYLTDQFWVAAGYHHTMQDGDLISARPLIKAGYFFNDQFEIKHRTRFHIDKTGTKDDDVYTNTFLIYKLSSLPVKLQYNHAKLWEVKSTDHEFQVAWSRKGFQPYIEYRDQKDGETSAFVLGGSIKF